MNLSYHDEISETIEFWKQKNNITDHNYSHFIQKTVFVTFHTSCRSIIDCFNITFWHDLQRLIATSIMKLLCQLRERGTFAPSTEVVTLIMKSATISNLTFITRLFYLLARGLMPQTCNYSRHAFKTKLSIHKRSLNLKVLLTRNCKKSAVRYLYD